MGEEPLQIRALLSELPDRDRVREGRADLLELLLDEGLTGKLGQRARDAGLDLGELRSKALAERDDLLAGADPAWVDLSRARRAQRALDPRRYKNEPRAEYFGRLSSLLLRFPEVAFWVLIQFVGTAALAWIAYSLVRGGRLLTPMATGAVLFLIAIFVRQRTPRLRFPALKIAIERADAAANAYATQLREAGVAGWLREQINAARPSRYGTALQFGDRSGLAEIDDEKHEIPTGSKSRLLDLIEDEAMPGGALGLAGPRGAGKSTLMRSICTGADRVKLSSAL